VEFHQLRIARLLIGDQNKIPILHQGKIGIMESSHRDLSGVRHPFSGNIDSLR